VYLILVWPPQERNESKTQALEGQTKEKSTPAAPEIIARASTSLPFREEQPGRALLTLWKYKLCKPESIKNAPEKFNNDLAFVLVASDVDSPKTGRVVWVAYGQSRESAGDRAPEYNWDIRADMIDQVPHVILVRSQGNKVLAAVYHLDRSKSLGVFPLVGWDAVDPRRKGWPPVGAKPFAFKEFTIRPKAGEDEKSIGVESIKAIRSGSDLTVSCQRIGAKLPALHYRYNMESKQWSEIALKEKESAGKE
jgi:hypothetical protein